MRMSHINPPAQSSENHVWQALKLLSRIPLVGFQPGGFYHNPPGQNSNVHRDSPFRPAKAEADQHPVPFQPMS